MPTCSVVLVDSVCTFIRGVRTWMPRACTMSTSSLAMAVEASVPDVALSLPMSSATCTVFAAVSPSSTPVTSSAAYSVGMQRTWHESG